MNWLEYLGNKKPIDAIFLQPPRLDAVRLLELILHQNGARLSMRINLADFPDKSPANWISSGYNQCQITLVFLELQHLTIKGWSYDNIVSISLNRTDDGHLAAEVTGNTTSIRAEFLYAEVVEIGGYMREDPDADHP